MLIKEYFVGSNDVDPNLDLKVSSLFKIMQDVAVEHAEKLGVGKKATMDIGINWVITRFKVEFLRFPKYQETIKVITYPLDTIKFIFPRNFQIESMDGEILIKASSTWLIIDSSTRKIVMNPFNGNPLNGEHLENELSLPEKVKEIDSSLIEERLVRYSDTDLNGHMNNTKYIDYIIDTHSNEFYKANKITKLIINYNKELKDGDLVKIYSNKSNPEFIKGECDSHNIFDVEITYGTK